MHIVYAPENPADGDRQEWTWTPGRVRAGEAERIQAEFGGTWDEFQAGVQQGDIRARRVMLWHLQRLTHPSLRLEDVPDFYSDELTVEYTVKELTEFMARTEKSLAPKAQKESALLVLRNELAKATEREAAAGGEPGKAGLTTPSTDGGSPSPAS